MAIRFPARLVDSDMRGFYSKSGFRADGTRSNFTEGRCHNHGVNRLANERSPYLIQHANNPVDWFPWGDEAFARARGEDKPIFLSVGYSTCHWCHVMEHESFENDAVAAVLNRHFVSIKVDREERPDIDRVYMAFVQATTGSGGWPMSVWLTPDLKPFFGGTYFPPSARWGRPGFVEVLQQIAEAWSEDRARVASSADAVTERLRELEHQSAVSAALPGADALDRTLTQFEAAFDVRFAGFGDAPKFPRPSELLFLLREHARRSGAKVAGGGGGEGDVALGMALRTLRAMALGGMRDHIGGGFHRYSVDAAWRVPHFEKMLYDQAQLVLAYVEAAQAAGDPFYLEVAEDTLRYVMREMTDEAGGFYSAEDADSVPPEHAGSGAHKSEGAFYLWRSDELDALLGEDAAVAKRRFGVEPEGNAPADPQQEFTGKNLLFVARTIDELAAELQQAPDDIVDALSRSRLAMFRHRLRRDRPDRDDKILTAWNGLTIAAFARMARALAPTAGAQGRGAAAAPYLEAARRAALFVQERLWSPATLRLLRRYRGGHADIDAYAEDYACLIFGVLELFQADPDPAWLEWAITLQRRQDELFWDEQGAGWFSTTGRDPSVLVRMKEDYDGAEPTASAVSVMNLLVLSHLVPEPAWHDRIERTLRAFAARLEQMGRAVPMMSAALAMHLTGLQQIVVIEGSGGAQPAEQALEDALARRYLPFAIHLRLTPADQERLGPRLPFVAAMVPVDGKTSAYICRDRTCLTPATEVDELEGALTS
jgi:uncharacterized protein YyaL (SSP411 family)